MVQEIDFYRLVRIHTQKLIFGDVQSFVNMRQRHLSYGHIEKPTLYSSYGLKTLIK